MGGTSVGLAGMKPGGHVRALNIEMKELMGEISRVIGNFVRGGSRDGGSHRLVVVDEGGATLDEELGVVAIDLRVQTVTAVAP